VSRLEEANKMYAMAMKRLENPIIDERQKIPAGEEVYIRPIYENYMLHFKSDLITAVKGTYAQMFGGTNFDSYSTEVSSWYDEHQLMPTNGRTIEECRNVCAEYFGVPYADMAEKRKVKTEVRNSNSALSDGVREAHQKYVKSIGEAMLSTMNKNGLL